MGHRRYEILNKNKIDNRAARLLIWRNDLPRAFIIYPRVERDLLIIRISIVLLVGVPLPEPPNPSLL